MKEQRNQKKKMIKKPNKSKLKIKLEKIQHIYIKILKRKSKRENKTNKIKTQIIHKNNLFYNKKLLNNNKKITQK